MTRTSLIAAGTLLSGRLSSDCDLRFEGHLDGEIIGSGALTVGAGACVVGPLQAHEIVVEGIVHGSVTGVERVELRRGAKVDGDVTSACVVLAEGSDLGGRIVIRA